jgi:hypothetical protein
MMKEWLGLIVVFFSLIMFGMGLAGKIIEMVEKDVLVPGDFFFLGFVSFLMAVLIYRK